MLWELQCRSPAIEERLSADPYDDSLMEDFGELAEAFGDGSGPIRETYTTKAKAIEAAFRWVGDCCPEVDLNEVKMDLQTEGAWADEEGSLAVEVNPLAPTPLWREGNSASASSTQKMQPYAKGPST